MQTLTLGPNGPTVKSLGIGTWAWGDSLFWSYGKEYGEADIRAAFEAAVEAGIDLFDTAEVYGLGKSETLLGNFVQQAKASVQLATKYFPLPWRFMGSAVADALTESLKRLQQDRISLYQVHWPFDFFMGQEALMAALAKEVERGRIATIGVSNYSAEQMRQAHRYLAERGVPLAVNQVQYSLLARDIEKNGVLAAAKELDVAILAYCPLAQGLLTGKYSAENWTPPTGARRLDPRFSRQGLEKLAPLSNQLKQLGDRYQKTPAQVALNWLICQGNVIPIPGAKTAKQARDNAGALGWQLTAEEVAELAKLAA